MLFLLIRFPRWAWLLEIANSSRRIHRCQEILGCVVRADEYRSGSGGRVSRDLSMKVLKVSGPRYMDEAVQNGLRQVIQTRRMESRCRHRSNKDRAYPPSSTYFEQS